MTNPERLTLAALKARTARSHVRAEKSGVVADLLRKQASREAFVLLLRNLEPVYAALEDSLDRLATKSPVSLIHFPAVARQGALQGDLLRMAGPNWRELAIVPAAQDYAARVRDVAARQPDLLLAHAYVRYFGDLNGGQILRKLIGEALGIPAETLGFYDFSAIEAMKPFLALYRSAFEEALARVEDPELVLSEAEGAFEFNISVSNECQACARRLSA